jgi:hypothetical protein
MMHSTLASLSSNAKLSLLIVRGFNATILLFHLAFDRTFIWSLSAIHSFNLAKLLRAPEQYKATSHVAIMHATEGFLRRSPNVSIEGKPGVGGEILYE